MPHFSPRYMQVLVIVVFTHVTAVLLLSEYVVCTVIKSFIYREDSQRNITIKFACHFHYIVVGTVLTKPEDLK